MNEILKDIKNIEVKKIENNEHLGFKNLKIYLKNNYVISIIKLKDFDNFTAVVFDNYQRVVKEESNYPGMNVSEIIRLIKRINEEK